ncbi:efflux RND transporter periplasmic adaptor subunit [Caulobacter sp. NIBR1757]|uniref:HlyD family secretion protein n=1 Tax=Caulobacter sp. NIBR1757 TaxID=3016000 RepID=UPI0022F0A290|nr:efflux RND transporter periplasmic adaptor subunit [Caulobacter sp. NIBR1757]WGM40108.1 Multidrug resistance protein MdtA [Caulobacter sp. NIBR1757]
MPGFLRKPWFWILTVIVVAGVGGFFLMKAGAAQKKKQDEAAAKNMPVSPFAAIGNGKADVEGGVIQVAARRGGVVKFVYVEEGEAVVAGQILARQEDDDPRLAVASARARVNQAEAQIGVLQVKLNAARREYRRLEDLLASNFVAKQRMDQKMDEIRDWEAQIAAQRATVATSRAALNEAEYALEQTVIRAPIDGRIARRYANPGAGASTLNVSTMFDLEPNTARIVRAEIVEADIPNVKDNQQVEITPESDPNKVYVGKVLRRAGVFGARKLASDDPSQRSDERVVEVVVSADGAPLLVGQRVLVKFMKPGFPAGAVRAKPKTDEATKK